MQAIGQYNLQPTRTLAQMSTSGVPKDPQSTRLPILGPLPGPSGTTSRGHPVYNTGPSIGTTGGQGIVGISGGSSITAGPVGTIGSIGSIGSIQGPGSSYGGPSSSSQYPGQPQFGSQQSYSHQPLIGRMSSNTGSAIGRYSSTTSQQLTSPFVPASTTHPIGQANWHPGQLQSLSSLFQNSRPTSYLKAYSFIVQGDIQNNQIPGV